MKEYEYLNILDESKLKIMIENNEILLFHENGELVGKKFFPFRRKIKQKASIRDRQKHFDYQSQRIQEAIQDILYEVVIERAWYDVWISNTTITFYSPSQNRWITEPKTKIYGFFCEHFKKCEERPSYLMLEAGKGS